MPSGQQIRQQQNFEHLETKMSSLESNNLQKLIERLENVTSRLESVSPLKAGQTNGSSSSHASSSAATFESFDSLPSITAFDDLNATLSTFTKYSREIGKDVEIMVINE